MISPTLLILSTGTSDVQLVQDGMRWRFDPKTVGDSHRHLESLAKLSLVDAPPLRAAELAPLCPPEPVTLCTPKLDAILALPACASATHVLILETRRNRPGDPILAGRLFESRLHARLPAAAVTLSTYLQNRERLEIESDPYQAIISFDVVSRIESAIQSALAQADFARVLIAPAGGMKHVTHLIEEIAQLHAGSVELDIIEVPEPPAPLLPKPARELSPPIPARSNPPLPTAVPERAVSRRAVPEPAESFRARRLALAQLRNGNLIGAWGAASHLHLEPRETHWTRVLHWLYLFATSLPIPSDCDIEVLNHHSMAVRAALRVEFALLSGDIPRAVHGTVAFFESALWDLLKTHIRQRRGDTYLLDPLPTGDLLTSVDSHRGAFSETANPGYFRILDGNCRGVRLATHYLTNPHLAALGRKIDQIRDLRNDVAHTEPTPAKMDEATQRMQDVGLWSSPPLRFLSQSLVSDVLTRSLGIGEPGSLHSTLFNQVHARLISPKA